MPTSTLGGLTKSLTANVSPKRPKAMKIAPTSREMNPNNRRYDLKNDIFIANALILGWILPRNTRLLWGNPLLPETATKAHVPRVMTTYLAPMVRVGRPLMASPDECAGTTLMSGRPHIGRTANA